jgi:hypothetical protein
MERSREERARLDRANFMQKRRYLLKKQGMWVPRAKRKPDAKGIAKQKARIAELRHEYGIMLARCEAIIANGDKVPIEVIRRMTTVITRMKELGGW